VQPLGCIWPLSDMHAKLAANAIVGNYNPPPDMRQRIAREVAQIRRTYLHTARHTIEVDYHEHLRALQREVPKGAPEWKLTPV
jgi:hypothetical protein